MAFIYTKQNTALVMQEACSVQITPSISLVTVELQLQLISDDEHLLIAITNYCMIF